MQEARSLDPFQQISNQLSIISAGVDILVPRRTHPVVVELPLSPGHDEFYQLVTQHSGTQTHSLPFWVQFADVETQTNVFCCRGIENFLFLDPDDPRAYDAPRSASASLLLAVGEVSPRFGHHREENWPSAWLEPAPAVVREEH